MVSFLFFINQATAPGGLHGHGGLRGKDLTKVREAHGFQPSRGWRKDRKERNGFPKWGYPQ